MAHVDTLVAEAELDFGRKFEQAQEVGDGGTFFANSFAQAFLREGILVDELLESQGYFDGVEVFALNVLDESHFGQLGFVGRADIGGYGGKTGKFGGTISALSGYDLIAFGAGLTQRNRLNDA